MNDRRQYLAEFRGDQQQSFLVELGGGDLRHGHDLAGGGELVGDEAVVGELQRLLDAHAGVTEDLDDGPGPERAFLFHGQIPPPPGGGVVRIDAG
ncbi:hypothetical protein ACFY3J_34095 [Streptomyces sp. NPDC001231]|uniref:hypothetical protein n=1 Tax=Streptomyces sp. NPDC001231 TaxID=3364549 RepID=UPI0036C9E297